MSRISVELKGKKGASEALRQASQDVQDAVEKEVVRSAILLRRDVVRSVERGPASGRVYEKYKPRRTHQASAPGQPPMADTGRLANNIYFERLGPVTAAVGSTLVYAKFLEYGTTRMAARPFFRPAVERMRAKFNQRLEAAITGALR